MQTVLLAEEYYPEGTKWTEIRLDTQKYESWYSKVGDEWVPNFETIEYVVKGYYTAENGYAFRCVYTSSSEWTDSLTLLLQEEEDAEYVGQNCVMASVLVFDHNGSPSTSLLWPGLTYQFDWSIGKGIYFEDILSSNTTSITHPRFYYGIIGEIKEGDFGGVRPLKYVDLDGKAPDNEPGSNIINTDTNGGRIIQGIGITEWNDGECLLGPPNPYAASGSGLSPERHYRSMLVHFERHGEVLYDVWPEKGTSSGVKSISKAKTPVANTPYDLQGRKLQRAPQRGVYIKDGKKYILHEHDGKGYAEKVNVK